MWCDGCDECWWMWWMLIDVMDIMHMGGGMWSCDWWWPIWQVQLVQSDTRETGNGQARLAYQYSIAEGMTRFCHYRHHRHCSVQHNNIITYNGVARAYFIYILDATLYGVIIGKRVGTPLLYCTIPTLLLYARTMYCAPYCIASSGSHVEPPVDSLGLLIAAHGPRFPAPLSLTAQARQYQWIPRAPHNNAAL